MKLISWNVNGIRAVQKKGYISFVQKQKPDILCLQETKIAIENIDELEHPAEYQFYLSPAKKKGYSGVATYITKGLLTSKSNEIKLGLGKKAFDEEGRFLVTKHNDFILYNIYIPSGTMGEERQNFKYKFLDFILDYLKKLPKAEFNRSIICGDFNICHNDIDIHHPEKATKLGLSGFLPDERAWMNKFTELGFVDTFRFLHPKKQAYSWWTYRAGAREKNLGWRIDYFFVASALSKRIKRAEILSDVQGSDHCPILLELK